MLFREKDLCISKGLQKLPFVASNYPDQENSIRGQTECRERFPTSEDVPRPRLEVRKEAFPPSWLCPLLLCCHSQQASQLAVTLAVASLICTDSHWINATTTNHIMSYQTAKRWNQLPSAADRGSNHTQPLQI